MGQASGQTTQDKQMQRGDQRQCIDMQCTAQPGLSSLKGWRCNGCLFFDDWKHYKLLSLTRERVSPRVSLPYSAKWSALCSLLKGFLGLGNALFSDKEPNRLISGWFENSVIKSCIFDTKYMA